MQVKGFKDPKDSEKICGSIGWNYLSIVDGKQKPLSQSWYSVE